MTQSWPWLALAGLGMFHGINPAMGWLFAVALGLHRHSRRTVLFALAPIALGHALSIGIVAAAIVLLGVVIDMRAARIAGGTVLIIWAFYHWFYGHRHRVRVGMTTGFAGLVLWSFLMATGHGAGVMLVPALIPLCMTRPAIDQGSLAISFAAVGVHTLAMLSVAGVIAISVYSSFDLEFLKRRWINFDLLWSVALLVTGTFLVIA